MLTCAWCGEKFDRAHRKGPPALYCTKAHREAAYRGRLILRARKGETAGLPLRAPEVISGYLIRNGIKPAEALVWTMDIVKLLKEESWSEH